MSKPLLVYETHAKENRTGMDGKSIRSPYLPESDKLIEPLGYVEDEEDEEDFNLDAYSKRLRRVEDFLKSRHFRFHFTREEEFGMKIQRKVTRKIGRKTEEILSERFVTVGVNEDTYYVDVEDKEEYLFASTKFSEFKAFLIERRLSWK